MLNRLRFFLCLLLISCDGDVNKCCDCLESEGVSDAYIYPILPGTAEWQNLETGAEKYEACQIPGNLLDNMCSIGLIDSWLTYPMQIVIFAWDQPQAGFEQLRLEFNGLEELLSRNDIGEKLFNTYVEYNPSGYDPNWSITDKGKYSIILFIIELTQAQDASIKSLSSAKRKEVVKEALNKRVAKESDSLYSPLSDISDAYLISRILLFEKYTPFVNEISSDNDLEFFTRTCMYVIQVDSPDPRLKLNKILDHANEFIKD